MWPWVWRVGVTFLNLPLAIPLPAHEVLKAAEVCAEYLQSAVVLEVSKEFMKLRRILKFGTVKIYAHAVSHTALIWIWNLECWLASRPWSCEGERSHFKWLLPKTLQFSVILALENTLLTFWIQALTSVRLSFLSTLFLKLFARGRYWCERVWNGRSGKMKKQLIH